MTPARLEHINITVDDIAEVLRFVRAALPSWEVRGGGEMDWFGKPIRWLHIGTEDTYLALQSGGEGEALHWTGHRIGAKHVGIVVDSVAAVVARLRAAGFELDHWGGEHPHRRSAYVIAPGSLQFEFVQYHSTSDAERNDYTL